MKFELDPNDLKRPVIEFATAVQTTLRENQTLEEAIISLRQREIDEKIVYFYVVDDENHLKGTISTRHLLLNPPDFRIKDVMTRSVISLQQDQTLEKGLELLSSHRFLAVPVVDAKKRLKGIINVQTYLSESFDIASARHVTDVFQILGLTLELGRRKSAWKSYKRRMPWILCNIAGGLACATISFFFKAVLAKVLLLAMFIPLVLTLNESISMQSMTQSLHFTRHAIASPRQIIRRILQGAKMIFMLSGTCGIIVGVISLLWGDGIGPSSTIALSLFLSISLSAFIGSSIPWVLHAQALDPKVASGPVVLMLVDVVATTIYLSLATLLLL